MTREPSDYIKDITDSIDNIENFIKGFSFDEFYNDRKTIYAVIRAIEIIGEAVKNIPETVRDKHPEIPWKLMVGMRDKLIHGYFGVDLKILWKTATVEIMKLKPKLLIIQESELFKKKTEE